MATIWFFLLAAIFTAYAVLDGWDLGVGTIHRWVARTDEERQLTLAAIGPLWSGNEVWLLAGGGSLFFSFPRVYAVGFSGFYLALMLVLWLLILRGISLEFRGQLRHHLWTTFWDSGFMVGSALLALLLGVALGNVVRGLPLDGRGLFQGSFGLMLNPYSLIVGILSLVILSVHGANFLCLKTAGPVYDRARALSIRLGWATALLVILVSVWSPLTRPHLLDNFARWPILIIFPLLIAASLVGLLLFTRRGQDTAAFAAGTGLIISLLVSAALSVYPDLLHSTIAPRYNLNIANTASSTGSLTAGFILIGSALVLVAICQTYVHRHFLGKIDPTRLKEHYH